MTRRLLCLVFVILTVFIYNINSHGHSHDHGHAHDHGHGHGHAHDHGHDHGHGHSHEEPPSFKYSREANEQHHGHAHSHKEETVTYPPPHYNEGSDDDDDYEGVASFSVMTWAIGSTIAISLAPIVIVYFIPVTNKPEHQSYLKILLSFASGGLLGDAFLHLIPHAMSGHGGNDGHGHSHSHSHSTEHDHSADIHIGLNVLLGIFLFLIVEKFVRHVKGHGHSHSHSHEPVAPVSPDTDDSKADGEKKKQEKKSPKKPTTETAVVVPKSTMKISGYLNLIADGLHNFTDGLAIGSSYAIGRKVGSITTIAIFFHEIPHEIGDYAILVQNGCSRKKAMFLQLTTAIGALLGCLVGLLFYSAGTELWAQQTFLPITAGGFIYIATVSVIPELLETNSGFKQSVYEMIALILGVAAMVVVGKFE